MGETRKMAAEKLDHLLSTAGLDEEARAHVIVRNKIRTIRALMLLEEKQLDALTGDNFVLGDAVLLKSVQNWVQVINANGDDLTVSLDMFKEKFNEEYYESSLNKAKEPDPQLANRVMTSTDLPRQEYSKQDISVKLTDYPEFDGKNSSWYTFRQEFEATAAIHQKLELLNVVNAAEHTNKRKEDPMYNAYVREVFFILMRKTAKGTALNIVLHHKESQDGALAWKDLCNYYDQEGDKEIFASRCLNDLMNLKLHYNSHGGMDKYLSDFEVRCRQLEEAGEPLSERQKKTMLLQGITDRDYDATKQICAKEDYQTVVLTLRHRAAELGKTQNSNNRRNINKASTYSSRRANKVTKGMKSRFNRNNEEEDEEEGNEEQREPGLFLPSNVWESMSPDNRKMWIEMRKIYEDSKKKSEEKSEETRQANVTTTNCDSQEKEKEKNPQDNQSRIVFSFSSSA